MPKNKATISMLKNMPFDKHTESSNIEIKLNKSRLKNPLLYYNLQNPIKTQVVQRGEKVNLEFVYKVVRIYSFWKTCTSFHRIITMIEKINNDKIENSQSLTQLNLNTSALNSIINVASASNLFVKNKKNVNQKTSIINNTNKNKVQPFKKRLFIQYLWRNAKLQEKVRVQKEFDMHSQQLNNTIKQKKVNY